MKRGTIVVLLGCLLSLVTYLGVLRARLNMLNGISFVLILAYVYFNYGRLFATKVFLGSVLSFFAMLFWWYGIAAGSLGLIIYYALASALQFFCPFAFFAMLLCIANFKSYKRYVIFTMIIVFVSSVLTLRAGMNASRVLAGNAEALGAEAAADAAALTSAGVMGYGFVHAVPFMGLGLVAVWKNARTVYFRNVAVLLNLVLFAMVFRSGFSTAILMYATFLLFAMIGSRHVKVTALVGGMLLAVLVVLWKTGVVLAFLLAIKPYLGESAFTHKIDALEESRKDVQGSSYINGRWELYDISWNSFLEHPVFGNSKAQTGGHSAMLDSLARIGLFGTIVGLLPFVWAYRFALKSMPKANRWYLHIGWVGLLIFHFLKASAMTAQAYTCLVVLPVLLLWREEDYAYASAYARRYFRFPPRLVYFG